MKGAVERKIETTRPGILVSGVRGWSLRNVVHSGLLKLLATRANVCVVIERDRYADIDKLANAYSTVEFLEVDAVGPSDDDLKRAAYPYRNLLSLYHDIHIRKNNETFRAKYQHGYIDGLPRGLRGWSLRALAESLHRVGLRTRLESRVDAAIAKHPQCVFWERVFRDRNIKALYLPSTFTTHDHILASVGRYYGLAVHGGVRSWDNLANKGRLPGDLQSYFVWGAEMRRQLLSYYPRVKPMSIIDVGPLQFDWHSQDRWHLSRREFCHKHGLDAGRPYVMYASSAPAQAPGEHYIVEQLLEALSNSPLDAWSPQIYLRLHPKDDGTRFTEMARRYRQLVVDRPNPTGDANRWSPDGDEIRRLVNGVRHASVVVNIFSTMTVDAIVHDRPVINVSWSPNSPIPWPGALGKDYTHFLPVLAARASPIATNANELIDAVAQYLYDDSLHRSERLRVLALLCGQCDGLAHRRIASHLMSDVGIPTESLTEPASNLAAALPKR